VCALLNENYQTATQAVTQHYTKPLTIKNRR